MTPAQFKGARHALGLTQQSLADALGVSIRTIRHWESGEFRPNASSCFRVEIMLKDATEGRKP